MTTTMTTTNDEGGPVWIITDPAKPYPDGRFDGISHSAIGYDALTMDTSNAHRAILGLPTPPLDPQQPTPEDMERELYMLRSLVEDYKLRYEAANEVATAARDALPDIETVFRHWGYIQTHPLPELRALLDLLTPPTPKWEPRKGGDF